MWWKPCTRMMPHKSWSRWCTLRMATAFTGRLSSSYLGMKTITLDFVCGEFSSWRVMKIHPFDVESLLKHNKEGMGSNHFVPLLPADVTAFNSRKWFTANSKGKKRKADTPVKSASPTKHKKPPTTKPQPSTAKPLASTSKPPPSTTPPPSSQP